MTPGTYTLASVTVDQQGRITSASSGSVNLSGYVPYTGATSAVNLGTQALTAGAVTLSGTLTVPQGTPGATSTSIHNASFPEFGLSFHGNNKLSLTRNTTSIFEAGQSGSVNYLTMSSAGFLGFSAGTTAHSLGPPETCLSRSSSGVLEINSGVLGTHRDLILRNLTSAGAIQLGATGATPDVVITRDAANSLGIRNGANGQTVSVYNTWASNTSSERLQFQWLGNEARIGTAIGSAGGSPRTMSLGLWDGAANFTTALRVNTTGTVTIGAVTLPATDGTTGQVLQTNGAGVASWATVSGGGGGISSLNGLTDATQTFQAGTSGTNVGWVSAAGVHTLNIPDASATARGLVTTGTQTIAGAKTFSSKITVPATGQAGTGGVGNAGNGIDFAEGMLVYITGRGLSQRYPVYITGNSSSGSVPTVKLASDCVISWESATDPGTSPNPGTLQLARWANDHLTQRRGTNAQTFSVTNTYSSDTSFERVTIGWSSNICTIATEKGSAGGADRSLRVQGFEIPVNYTASPNNTVNHLSMQATGATANVSVSIVPKGTGSFSLAVPDGTAVGGNVRGAYSIDLQTERTAATQVAGSDRCVAIGARSTATGTAGHVAIGYGATASGGLSYSTAIGSGAQALNRSTAIDGVASGQDSVAIRSATAQHGYAVCLGFGAGSRWDGHILWRGGVGIGSYGQSISCGGHNLNVPYVRTIDSTQTTLSTIYSNFVAQRYRHTGMALLFRYTVLCVRSDGAVNKYSRTVLVKDKSNVAGTSSTLSILQAETIGTDLTEIPGISVSASVASATKALNVTVTGESGFSVTGDAITNTLTAVGHNLQNGDVVVFSSLTGGSGLSANPGGNYFQGHYSVINVSGDTFQLASAGTTTPVIDFTTDITAGVICRPILWHLVNSEFSVVAGGY